MSEAPPVTSAGRARLSRVEQVMGMPVVIEVCDPDIDDAAIERVYRWLRHVDSTFSTYEESSEISRMNRGELRRSDASLAVRSVLRRCEWLCEWTGGFFDISASMPNGGVDPSGLVKGWSVAGGARLLEQAGARNFCIDAGGDVIVSGDAPQGGPWRIGVAHPLLRDAIACTVALSDAAIATSGAYERGAHIIDPRTGAAANGLLSVTVIGSDLPLADAAATAAFAMGRDAPDWCARQQDLEFMLVTDDEQMITTAGFERYRVREPVAARSRGSRAPASSSTTAGLAAPPDRVPACRSQTNCAGSRRRVM
jgi:FAD:protein FMN transferase